MPLSVKNIQNKNKTSTLAHVARLFLLCFLSKGYPLTGKKM